METYCFQEELLEGYKREEIDPTPYYWYTDQVCLFLWNLTVNANFCSVSAITAAIPYTLCSVC